nr:nitroreductase [Rhodovastum atsumiense]
MEHPVLAAIESRRSVRAFLPTPVPRETIARILTAAARAPSGANIQPWQVHVVTGAARARLCAALQAAAAAPDPEVPAEYDYYPRQWFEPYLGRRRQLGWELYGLLGIGRRDTAAMQRQHHRNFDFFDAPVGVFFTLDRRLGAGSWLDCGMFMQNVMVAARAFGLHTCAQAAFTSHHQVIRAELGLAEEQILLAGMALGHEDTTRPENALRTARVPVDGFTTFHED